MATRNPGKKVARKDVKEYLCPYCNTVKKEKEFYISSDPLVMTGKTSMCKDCAEKIARNWDERKQMYGECTKASVQEALERLDKPWIDKIWDSSYFEYVNGGEDSKRPNIWAAYIKNIGMPQYKGMRWRDGDLFSNYKEAAIKQARQEVQDGEIEKFSEVNEEYEKNKLDVIRLLGYDPFEKELEEDKPLLYSQLIGYLDASGDNEDMMRTSSAITIVRGFLQQAKLDDMIAKAMSSPNMSNKTGEIKACLDSKQKIAATISNLAEQSCLSLKHNKNQSKGENTLTGIIRKVKDMNLRDAEVNAFDIGTAEGMRQVADISNASIMRQIRLDENDYTEMLAQQRELIHKLEQKANKNEEAARILLRENLDLKQYITEQGIDISKYCSNNEIISSVV